LITLHPTLPARPRFECTNAYLLDQLSLGVETTRRARSWLQQRAKELRQLSGGADLAVKKFKADNNLLSTKGTPRF
jgi:polysaccharide biosynthesis transport protein